MAKVKKENADLMNDFDSIEEEDGGKKKKKLTTSLIAVLIVLVWIIIFILLVKLDVGGFGSSVLHPVLKDVPVLNKILPKVDEEGGLSSQSGTAYKTLQEAIDRINELENEIAIDSEKADENAETISNLTAEINRLKTYEANQTNYENLKKKFDEEVVFNDKAPDIDKYKEWYEALDPENAAEIYRQVTEQLALDEVIQNQAKQFASMEPEAAAAVLEEMTGDFEKVSKILMAMKPQQAGNILAAMDSTIAAKLTLLIYPTENN